MKRTKRAWGASGDAILLAMIKLVTIVLGFAITRLLSQYLSVYDYGTYSQIMLVVSTVNTITVLGMIDGVNYFYCRESDPDKRESYVATIFALQGMVNVVAGSVVLLLSGQISIHFDNPDVKPLLIFSAVLPLLINLVSMLQVLLVSVGKARMLAIRNLLVSLIRLGAALFVAMVIPNVLVVLVTTLVMDLGQIGFFVFILWKNDCPIRLNRVDFRLVWDIISYCAPMGIFTAVSALNRDMDKYLVALMTDTETLAVYANASKMLPFDVLMAAFCTVLIPAITRSIAGDDREKAAKLYRLFLEISYISNTIMCCAALTVAPQLMELLYSEKYAAGLPVFCIYILVDLIHVTNITLVLSSAGKTSLLMLYSIGALAINTVLNVVLYALMGITGPALATLITSGILGVCIVGSGAKILGVGWRQLFDRKFLALFMAVSLVLLGVFSVVQTWLAGLGIAYPVILFCVGGCYGVAMLLFGGKRLLGTLKEVNRIAK